MKTFLIRLSKNIRKLIRKAMSCHITLNFSLEIQIIIALENIFNINKLRANHVTKTVDFGTNMYDSSFLSTFSALRKAKQ